MIPPPFRMPGRPRKDRAAVAQAFVAKAVYDMPTTRVLLHRLATDVVLRRICGWERRREMPSEVVVRHLPGSGAAASGRFPTAGRPHP